MLKDNLEQIALNNIDWVQGYLSISDTNFVGLKKRWKKQDIK